MLRHIIFAGVAAMLSTHALAVPAGVYVWIPITGVETPQAPMLFTSGEQRTLADFKGKVVLVNFWATWCPPCRAEMPTLDALEKELAAKGLVVIALSVDRGITPEELRKEVAADGLSLPHTALDTTREVSRGMAYGLGVPVTFLIDRKGVIRYRYRGATDWTDADQKAKVQELLAERQ